ncbi:MAG: arsenate reductase ArsC [Thermoleophilaceae bacterium]
MKHVLFVCVQNAGRSQMAEAFFRRHAPDDVRAESAGSAPATVVHPEVIEVMNDVGIDLTGRKPRRLGLEMQLHADWAITMGCGDACPYVPTRVEDWDVPDPCGRSLDEVRAVRDEIEGRVRELIEERVDEIRTDRTAHQARLIRLLPDLAREFEGQRTPEDIRACADAVLVELGDAPVRSFLMTLAHRRTRECLAADECAVLASS